jgi:hypothetical protein
VVVRVQVILRVDLGNFEALVLEMEVEASRKTAYLELHTLDVVGSFVTIRSKLVVVLPTVVMS